MAMGLLSPTKNAAERPPRASSQITPRRDDLGGLASLRQNINMAAAHERCRQNADFRRFIAFVARLKQRVLLLLGVESEGVHRRIAGRRRDRSEKH
jgi:hypothetical protein